MPLLYKGVEIDFGRKEIVFPEPFAIVPKKQAIDKSAKCLDNILQNYSKEDSLRVRLDYARGKQGGCGRIIKSNGECYLVGPLRDWFPGIGGVKYVLDIQAGFTQDGQELRDANLPWAVFSIGEGVEETIHLVKEGGKYKLVNGVTETPNIKEYNLEIQERMLNEAGILFSHLNIDPNYYKLTELYLVPLQDRWTLHEKICEKEGKNNLTNTKTEYIQNVSIAFEGGTGGIEVIPGILVFEIDLPIASEKGEEGIYSIDTERDGNNWLNRITACINIKDGYTIAYQVDEKNKEIDIVFSGELEKAMKGKLWEPGKFPFSVTEKVKKIVEEFPKELGKPEGLQPLIDQLC